MTTHAGRIDDALVGSLPQRAEPVHAHGASAWRTAWEAALSHTTRRLCALEPTWLRLGRMRYRATRDGALRLRGRIRPDAPPHPKLPPELELPRPTIDVERQADALRRAADGGMPFVEECVSPRARG